MRKQRLSVGILFLSFPWITAGCRDNTADGPSSDIGVPVAEVQDEDLQEIIGREVAAGKKIITIPPGAYRVTPKNREHLLFRGLRDVTIVADGVEMICTETTRAITVENCENLTIRGLTVDYDPLPFTQTVVEEISSDGRQLMVEVIPGYQEPGRSTGSVEIFNPKTGRLRSRITLFGTLVEPQGPMTARLSLPDAEKAAQADIRIGDIAVVKTSYAPGGEIPHAIMSTDSKGLRFENVTLNSGNCFGFFENRCDGSVYQACRVVPRRPEQETVQRGIPRLRSMNADAFHSKNAEHGPHYEKCVARQMGDDGIAINGDFHFVSAVEGDSLRILAKHQMTMQVGDAVQILTFDGRRLSNRKIVSIETDGAITPAEREVLAGLQLNERLQKQALADAYRVTVSAGEEIPASSLICSADRIGDGFVIRDCEIGPNRARGILVKAGRGEISGNRLEGVTLTSILVSPEFWWLEAGMSDDLVIAGNTISNGGGMGIAIVAKGGDGSLAPAGAFRNITVRDNVVQGGAAPGLLLCSVEGWTEENNSIETDPARTLNSWETGGWGHFDREPVMKLNLGSEGSQP